MVMLMLKLFCKWCVYYVTFVSEPSSPVIIETLETGSESITLRWTIPDKSNGVIQNFNLQLTYTICGSSETKTESHQVSVTAEEQDKTFNYTFNSLQPNWNHVFNITASNSKGPGQSQYATEINTTTAGKCQVMVFCKK